MNSKHFKEAFLMACDLHRRQKRKGTEIPYIAHLLGVTAIVLESGGSEEEAIAALLHDAVEDQGGSKTLREIRLRFGDSVADIVEGCSDSKVTPKPWWRKRKERYIAHLSEASESVRRVSAADKLHNARAILSDYRVLGEKLWRRFHGGRKGTLWYYRELADTFLRLGPQELAGELDRVVSELQRLAGKE